MVVVAFDGVVPVDLAIPVGAFGHAQLADGRSPYDVKVCAERRSVDAGAFRMQVPHGLAALRTADVVIIPGIDNLARPFPRALLRAIVSAHARGATVASICSGAFLLAATGLLDGRRATTHWVGAHELARRHPSIAVDADVLYVDEGDVLTSAGAMAGLDLCLHMIRRDHGAAVAAASARIAVMPLERSGGQAQFIVHEPPPADHATGASLAKTLDWLAANLKRDLSVDAVARHAAMSTRTLLRRFKEQTGTTPAQWVTIARVRRAQAILETTRVPVENVADAAGFGSAVAFRARFKEIVGVSPLEYRRTFRAR